VLHGKEVIITSISYMMRGRLLSGEEEASTAHGKKKSSDST
jgi:hypothetical protein